MDKKQRVEELREDFIIYLSFLTITFSGVLIYILISGAKPVYILHSFMGLLLFFISRFLWGGSRLYSGENLQDKDNTLIGFISFIFKIILNFFVFYFLSIIIFIILTYLFFYTNEFFTLLHKISEL